MSVAPATPLRAAIYVRVSTPGQEQDGTSLETQEAACRRYAAEHGYSIDDRHVYREVHTGTELWERSRLQDLRDTIRRNTVDVVVCYAIDRLARDPVHLGVVISEADHADVPVEFVSEPLDNTPEGQLIRFVRGYAAKIEHAKIRERSLRGKRARSEGGRILPTARPRFGYRWADESKSRLVIDEATAAIMRRIFHELAAGTTLLALAKQLTAEKIPTPSGKPAWFGSGIRELIVDPIYIGEPVGWRWTTVKVKSKSGKTYRKRVQRPVEEHVALPASVAPAIVDRETFEAVQDRLKLNKQLAARNNKNPRASLLRGGFAHCGYCGSTMYAARCRNLTDYVCGRTHSSVLGCPGGRFRISTRILDDAVWARVKRIAENPDRIAAELTKMLENDPTEHDLVSVDRQLARVKARRDSYIEDLPNVPKSSKAAIYEQLDRLDAEQQQLDAERGALLARRQTWAQATQQLDALQDWCRTVSAKLAQIRRDDPQLALTAFGISAKVWKADHEPRWEITVRPGIDFPDTVVESTSIRAFHNRSLVLRWTDRDAS